MILTHNNVADLDRLCLLVFALYEFPDAINDFSSLIKIFEFILILPRSTIAFNLEQALIFDLCVVLGSFSKFSYVSFSCGSGHKHTGIVSSPNSWITIKADSPIVLFSTLQYMLAPVVLLHSSLM